MNNIEQKSNAPVEMTLEKKMELFRVEMKKMKEIEMNKKQAWEERGKTGMAYNPHFDGINPEYLGQAEQEVYEKYRKDDISVNSFNELKESATRKYNILPTDESDGEQKSVLNFWAYMSNLIQIRESRRQLEELRQKKASKIF